MLLGLLPKHTHCSILYRHCSVAIFWAKYLQFPVVFRDCLNIGDFQGTSLSRHQTAVPWRKSYIRNYMAPPQLRGFFFLPFKPWIVSPTIHICVHLVWHTIHNKIQNVTYFSWVHLEFCEVSLEIPWSWLRVSQVGLEFHQVGLGGLWSRLWAWSQLWLS